MKIHNLIVANYRLTVNFTYDTMTINMIFPKTTTVREIQRNYKKVFEQVKKTKEPVVVLKNNKPDVAVIDLATLEQMNKRLEELEIADALRSAEQGWKEYKAGKTVSAKSLADLLK